MSFAYDVVILEHFYAVDFWVWVLGLIAMLSILTLMGSIECIAIRHQHTMLCTEL
jgi:hypothetical protein